MSNTNSISLKPTNRVLRLEGKQLLVILLHPFDIQKQIKNFETFQPTL